MASRSTGDQWVNLYGCVTIGNTFCQHGSTLMPAWISNYIHYEVREEITYPFSNFNGWVDELDHHLNQWWITLQWRHNDHDSISNHQPRGCLLYRLFGRRSKKTSKLRVTGLCAGNSPGAVNSPHKGPVTRKMFPFDDVIMMIKWTLRDNSKWNHNKLWQSIR